MNNEIEVKLKEIISNGQLSPETALARIFKLGIIQGIETVLKYNDVLFDGYEKIEQTEVKQAVEMIKNSQEYFLTKYKQSFEE